MLFAKLFTLAFVVEFGVPGVGTGGATGGAVPGIGIFSLLLLPFSTVDLKLVMEF